MDIAELCTLLRCLLKLMIKPTKIVARGELGLHYIAKDFRMVLCQTLQLLLPRTLFITFTVIADSFVMHITESFDSFLFRRMDKIHILPRFDV